MSQPVKLLRAVMLVVVLLLNVDATAASVMAFDPARIEALDEGVLRELLTGRQRNWPDGTAVVVVLPGRRHPEFDAVARWLGYQDGASMQRGWLRIVFSGRGNAPVFAESPQAAADIVQRTQGAIGVSMSSSGMRSVALSPAP